VKTCWAGSLLNCSSKLSREHLVTEVLFESTQVRVGGFPWCKGEERIVGLSSVVRKILCTHHNSQLSPVDQEACTLFDEVRKATTLQDTRARRKGSTLFENLCGGQTLKRGEFGASGDPEGAREHSVACNALRAQLGKASASSISSIRETLSPFEIGFLDVAGGLNDTAPAIRMYPRQRRGAPAGSSLPGTSPNDCRLAVSPPPLGSRKRTTRRLHTSPCGRSC
jgi:hypothetical protein